MRVRVENMIDLGWKNTHSVESGATKSNGASTRNASVHFLRKYILKVEMRQGDKGLTMQKESVPKGKWTVYKAQSSHSFMRTNQQPI